MIGRKFSKLTVIQRDIDKPSGRHKPCYWICRCDCGNEISVITGDLKSGNTKSCGCYKAERLSKLRTTHKKSRTKLYNVWNTMKSRCYNEKAEKYKDYGARGITVCDEWLHNFQAFYEWAMANGYEENLTIDRKDVNGNYEPSNCRWSTTKEQANNKRTNRYITYNGETHTLAEWAEIRGITQSALRHRLARGWALDKALSP